MDRDRQRATFALEVRVRVWFTSDSGGTGTYRRVRRASPSAGHPGTRFVRTDRDRGILSPVAERTRLVIEQRGIPVGELATHGAGWQAHVEDLATYLAGSEPRSWRLRWTELTPAYEQLACDLR